MQRSNSQDRLGAVVEMMREMSRHTDPQTMVRNYGERVRRLNPTDRMVSISRRNLAAPSYRITRSSLWKEAIDPWQEVHRLPLLQGGLLGELLYAGDPRIIDDLHVPSDDPAADYFADMRSLMALPNYDGGEAINMVVVMKSEPGFFDRERLPEMVQMSNLFGRATHNLVLSEELRRAYDVVDREMAVVADIQRSLLPPELPKIAGMNLAVHYQTSRKAGGDYYDFFRLPEGKWGILIADVSGHGTPAAVIMAIMHSIAHTHPGPVLSPETILTYVNAHLTRRYTLHMGAFVTAFYGIYDPATRELQYACAGHNPPRLKHCDTGQVESLDKASDLPLGIVETEVYRAWIHTFRPGDQIIFYTDGIIEALNPAGEMFGVERLDVVLSQCQPDAQSIVQRVLAEVERFSAGRPADDDRTVLVARIG